MHDVTPLGQQFLQCLVSGIIKDWMEDYFKDQLTRKNNTIPNMMLSALSGTKYYCYACEMLERARYPVEDCLDDCIMRFVLNFHSCYFSKEFSRRNENFKLKTKHNGNKNAFQ